MLLRALDLYHKKERIEIHWEARGGALDDVVRQWARNIELVAEEVDALVRLLDPVHLQSVQVPAKANKWPIYPSPKNY